MNNLVKVNIEKLIKDDFIDVEIRKSESEHIILTGFFTKYIKMLNFKVMIITLLILNSDNLDYIESIENQLDKKRK